MVRAVMVASSPRSFAAAVAAPSVPERAARMEATDVVVRRHRLVELALHLESGDEGGEEAAPADAAQQFCHGERGGKRRHRGVCEQPVEPPFPLGKLRVVPVHRVAGRPVPQRREMGGEAHGCVANDTRLRCAADLLHVAGQHLNRGLLRAGERDTEPVEDAAARDPQRLGRDLIEGEAGGEFDGLARQPLARLSARPPARVISRRGLLRHLARPFPATRTRAPIIREPFGLAPRRGHAGPGLLRPHMRR